MSVFEYARIMVCDAGPDHPDIETKVKVTFPDGQCRYFTFTNQTPAATARSIVIDAISKELKKLQEELT